jgi:membrane fusion protein, heavy metal efflux system
MIGRLSVLAIGLASGLLLAWAISAFQQPAMSSGPSQESTSTPERDAGAYTREQGVARLSPNAIEAAGIALSEVKSGTIARRIIVPGTVVPQADRIAHVAVKLSSIVAELRKNIGDPVERNEVLAILESREVADAKSEYLAARLTNELQQDLFERDKTLWEKKISSEQQFLRSRNEAARAKVRNDIARQKLFALGLTETEIAGLPDQPEVSLRHQEVRSPIAGHIVERKAELGIAVGRDNLETDLFVVADLDRVWVDLAVSPEDLAAIRIGQALTVATRGTTDTTTGKVTYIGPILDKDTRSARVIAEIDNREGAWRPGLFVTAAIAVEEQSVSIAIPVAAIQTMDGGPVVFVRTPEGFQRRPVMVGQKDQEAIEVVSGLSLGETIALSNTFLLKAEMLKGAAED